MGVGHDQASTLRDIAQQRQPQGEPLTAEQLSNLVPRTIAVASGKGGVGKTNLVANLALAYAAAGSRVLVVDGDLGLANLNLTLGVTPNGTLGELLTEDAAIEDILTPVAENLTILPACSGDYELANLEDRERHNLFAAIDRLEERFDTLIIDTGAGIGSNAVAFAAAAQQVVVVACPEPTSLADAYALIKVLAQKSGIKRVHLVANQVRNAAEGEEVYRQLADLLGRFLRVGLDYLGAINRDYAVNRCVRAGVPLLVAEPDAPASRCIKSVARRLADADVGEALPGGIRLFWKRLLSPSTARMAS